MLSSASPAVTMLAALRGRGAGAVLTRMRHMGAVGPDLIALIEGLGEVQSVRAATELIAEREPAARPRFLVSGWAARVRWLPDGRRQILGLMLPGDAVGLCLRRSPLALSTTVALTPARLLDAAPVQKAISSGDPRWSELREIVHMAESLDEAYLVNHVVRLGRQTAYERLCHLLLEMRDRLAMAGLGEGDTFPMPLTQEMLADAIGLSIVHVNRILQQLRREHLLDLHGGRARLLDRAALDTIADYRRPQLAARASAQHG
jgi:CRP-like cAMP-binding protein